MATLPLDMLTVILGHAPFSALNGLLRSCRALSTVKVDPTKWEVVEYDTNCVQGTICRYMLPNRVAHGTATMRTVCKTYDVVIVYDRGRVVTGFVLQQDQCAMSWARQKGAWIITRDGKTAPWLFGEPSLRFIDRWISASVEL